MFRNAVILDGNDRAHLSSLGFDVKRYPPRTVIERQGDGGGQAFIVQSGWGNLVMDLPDGGRQIIDYTLAGDVVGLGSVGRQSVRSFVSVTELVVFKIHAKAVFAAIAQSERLTRIFGAALERQRAILIQHLTDLGRRSAPMRTAHFFLELGTRLETAGMATSRQFECPLTQHDLADTLGLTPIHINRVLRQLREQNLLHFNRGRVEFLNRGALAQFAHFNSAYLSWDF